jgi:transcriptional regulator with XRE-family HTH domain
VPFISRTLFVDLSYFFGGDACIVRNIQLSFLRVHCIFSLFALYFGFYCSIFVFLACITARIGCIIWQGVCVMSEQLRSQIALNSEFHQLSEDISTQDTIYLKLRALRRAKGMTMRALAEQIGTSQQQVDRLEKGQRRLTLEWLEKLSSALECELMELLPQSQVSAGLQMMRAPLRGEVQAQGNIIKTQEQSYMVLPFTPAIYLQNLFYLRVMRSVFHFSEGMELVFASVDNLPEHDRLAAIRSHDTYVVQEQGRQRLVTSREGIDPAQFHAVLVRQVIPAVRRSYS